MLGWITGAAIKAVTQPLSQAWRDYLKAESEDKKLEAKWRIEQLQARQEVLIAEQRSMWTRWIRPAWALPFIIYDIKVLVWDKVLGLGTTDPMSPEFWYLQMSIAGAYFLTRPFQRK